MPKGIAVLGLIFATATVAFVVAVLLGDSLYAFSQRIPQYTSEIEALEQSAYAWLQARGVDTDLEGSALDAAMNSGGLLTWLGAMLAGVASLASNGFVILMLTAFLLLEVGRTRDVVEGTVGASARITDGLETYARKLVEYVKVKAAMSFGTGATIGLALWLLGIDYALLWGVLAFLLNFIPNIGSFIAAAPPVMLAMLQYGPGRGVLAAGVVIVINMAYSNVIEPRLLGKSFGMSPTFVFASLLFWGWVLGPVGMILAIPISVAIKLGLESSDDTRWLAGLMA